MVGVYSWHQMITEAAWPSGDNVATLMDTHLTLPPGKRLRKVLCKNNRIQGHQTGQNYTAIGNWTLHQEIWIDGGDYGTRIVHSQAVAIPGRVVGAGQEILFPDRYTQYLNAGDNELGFDQPMTYGHLTPIIGDVDIRALFYMVMQTDDLSNVVIGHYVFNVNCLFEQ